MNRMEPLKLWELQASRNRVKRMLRRAIPPTLTEYGLVCPRPSISRSTSPYFDYLWLKYMPYKIAWDIERDHKIARDIERECLR